MNNFHLSVYDSYKTKTPSTRSYLIIHSLFQNYSGVSLLIQYGFKRDPVVLGEILEIYHALEGRGLRMWQVVIIEDNLSRDFRYQMSNIEYPHVNNDWLWVKAAYQMAQR